MIELIALFLLVMLSGFFSSVETAFFSLDEVRVKYLKHKNVKNSELLYELRENPKDLLTTILIGNNLVNISASSIATYVAIDYFGSTGVGVATGIMTMIILIFGEIIPKSLATDYAEKIALSTSWILKVLMIVFYPFIFVLNYINDFTFRMFKLRKKDDRVYEEEIHLLADKAKDQGVIDSQEFEFVKKSIDFNEKKVRDIMTPLEEIFSLEEDKKLEDVVDDISEKKYSRIPLKDKKGKYSGLIYTKKILDYLTDEDEHDILLKDLKTDIMFIDEDKEIGYAFNEFRNKNRNMALVVDKKGKVVGLITMEDIVEEIVGELYDETEKRK